MATSPARSGTTALAGVGAAVLMLVLVTWAASIGPDPIFTGGSGATGDTAAPSPTPSATTEEGLETKKEELREEHQGKAPGWVRALAVLVEIAVLLVVVFLAVRLLLRLWERWRQRERRVRRTTEAVEFEVLDPIAEVAAAVEDDAQEQRGLLEEGEPRNAIVACWRRFEIQAGRADVVRRPWQTSSEFVLGVLDEAGADEGAVLRLAALFREARFSDHVITEQHREEALAALEAIHRTLGRRAATASRGWAAERGSR